MFEMVQFSSVLALANEEGVKSRVNASIGLIIHDGTIHDVTSPPSHVTLACRRSVPKIVTCFA